MAKLVKIGNHHSTRVDSVDSRGCRTKAQYDALMAHHRRHPAAWWGMNPFRQETAGQQFKCGFRHMYFDPKGRMCSLWVTGGGKIKDFACGESNPVFKAEADKTIGAYGVFRG